ncbi:GspH/FimT family pseudopilin [Chitinimonas lacunae]|uniref:Type II secretion system protein H n=1 Tax=Chitinimonas lacunae TaxID=1963018 RepID=A0ABV8MUP1_9NEIS
MKSSSQRGFTLIEMLVVIAIFGILMSYIVAAASEWMQSAKLRSMSEGIQNGMRLARTTAVSKNYSGGVLFTVTDTLKAGCQASSSGRNWVVSLTTPVGSCHSNPNINADPTVSGQAPHILDKWLGDKNFSLVDVNASHPQLRFDSLGRTFSGTAQVEATIDLTVHGKTCTEAGCSLRIMLTKAGKVQSCDPQLPDGKAGACK